MKDEEKTIEQIIADLEKMENETAAKKLKEQGDDVEKDIAFEEGALEESAEEPIEELTLEEPQEVPFDEAQEGSFEKTEGISLEEPVEERLAEAPPEDLLQEEPSSELPPVQTISSMQQDLSSEEPPPEEPGDEPPDEPPAPPPKKRSLPVSRTTVILLLFLIFLGLYAYFVYPTMYENRTMRSWDKTYPVKINRLTKGMQYYEMGKWHNGPIPKTSTYRARLTTPLTIPSKARVAPAEKKPLKAVEEAPVKAIEKAPAEEPAKAAVKTAPEAPAETDTKAPAKAPETAPVPSVEPSPEKKTEKVIEKAEKKAEKPEEVAIAKAELPPREEIVKPAKKYIYAIQISSMRFKEFAEEFLEDLEMKGVDVHMRVIETKKHGLWYTIYIGHFADREKAVTYMKEKKITDFYPGSCIRKMSNR